MSTIYYIDPVRGNDENQGLSPKQPKQHYRTVRPAPGDSVLFKRGSVMRDVLEAADGEEGAMITYGAYGEGEKPVFLGSVNITDANYWSEESPNLWYYCGNLPSEACNIIFNGGESCGNMRWTLEDLKNQGEWFYTHLGMSGNSATKEQLSVPEKLYLYSEGNPGSVYHSIECAVWSVNGVERRLAGGSHHIIFENLCFRNGGVHGLQSWNPRWLVVRHCDFQFIGGGIYNRQLRIRLGNGVEFWDSAEDNLVEDCVFYEVYDSCVTHQGSDTCVPAERVVYRHNLFVKYGMGAYECRDRLPIDTHFDNNICVRAGGGFAMQGEEPPRQSEIYPEPMGHHLFLWRIEKATPDGYLSIKNNIFYEAPYGAAIYSIISPEAAAQIELDNNCYYKSTDELYWHINGKSYTMGEFAAYQQESGQDKHSVIADPMFVGEEAGDFSLQEASPCNALQIKCRTNCLKLV